MALHADPPRSQRFHSAASHYLAGRPAYAPLLIHRVAALAGLTDQHAVLDLGCGPGPLARAFAPLAGQVVAVDPEPEMLRAATGASGGIRNIRFVAGGSDDLGPSLGRFRLVVMGRSFHWMDRAETLRRLDGLIEPDGAVVLFDTSHAPVPVNAWVERYNVVRRRYGSSDRGHPRRQGPNWLSHEAILLDSPFGCLESCSIYERRELDAASLVDRAFSSSSTEPDRLGEQAADLARDVADLIRDIAPNGCLTEVVGSCALIARRAFASLR